MSGLNLAQTCDLDGEMLEAALHPPKQTLPSLDITTPPLLMKALQGARPDTKEFAYCSRCPVTHTPNSQYEGAGPGRGSPRTAGAVKSGVYCKVVRHMILV